MKQGTLTVATDPGEDVSLLVDYARQPAPVRVRPSLVLLSNRCFEADAVGPVGRESESYREVSVR